MHNCHCTTQLHCLPPHSCVSDVHFLVMSSTVLLGGNVLSVARDRTELPLSFNDAFDFVSESTFDVVQVKNLEAIADLNCNLVKAPIFHSN